MGRILVLVKGQVLKYLRGYSGGLERHSGASRSKLKRLHTRAKWGCHRYPIDLRNDPELSGGYVDSV